MTAWGRTVRPDPEVPDLIWTVHTLSRISTEGGGDFRPLDRGRYSFGVASGLHSVHEWREEKPASRKVDRIKGSAVVGTATQGNDQSAPSGNAIRRLSLMRRGLYRCRSLHHPGRLMFRFGQFLLHSKRVPWGNLVGLNQKSSTDGTNRRPSRWRE